MSYESVSFEPGRPHPLPPPEILVADREDAKELVDNLLAKGVRPIITVPKELASEVEKHGISFVPKEDLATGRKYSFIAGTLNIHPYVPEEEERVVFEIDTEQVRVQPRFTGKDKAFHGVVAFPDGVPATALRPLGSFTQETWAAHQKKENDPLH